MTGARPDGDDPVDFAFLAVQTFDDIALQREVLALFVAQARRITATLDELGVREQGDAAHLLKGSARGIGAWGFASRAAAYEAGDATARSRLVPELTSAVDQVEQAIAAHPVFGAD